MSSGFFVNFTGINDSMNSLLQWSQERNLDLMFLARRELAVNLYIGHRI